MGNIVNTNQPIGYIIAYSLWSFHPDSILSGSSEGRLLEKEAGIALLRGPGFPEGFPVPLERWRDDFTFTSSMEFSKEAKKESLLPEATGADPIFFSIVDGFSLGGTYGPNLTFRAKKYAFSLNDKPDFEAINKKGFDYKKSFLMCGGFTESHSVKAMSKYDLTKVESFLNGELLPNRSRWLDLIKVSTEGDIEDLLVSIQMDFVPDAIKGTRGYKELVEWHLQNGSRGFAGNLLSAVYSLCSGVLGGGRNTFPECALMGSDNDIYSYLSLVSHGGAYLFVLKKAYKEFAFFGGRKDSRLFFEKVLNGEEKTNLAEELHYMLKSIGEDPLGSGPLVFALAFPIEAIFFLGMDYSYLPPQKFKDGVYLASTFLRMLGVVKEGWKVSERDNSNETPLIRGIRPNPVFPALRTDPTYYVSIILEEEEEGSFIDEEWMKILSKRESSVFRSFYWIFKSSILEKIGLCVKGRLLNARDSLGLELDRAIILNLLHRKKGDEEITKPRNIKPFFGSFLQEGLLETHKRKAIVLQISGPSFEVKKGDVEFVVPGDRIYAMLYR